MRSRTVWSLLGSFLVVGLSILPPALAETQTASIVSGAFSAGVAEQDGVSNYTVRYTYPDRVSVGSNLTVTATLEVNSLTGLKIYVRHYRFDAFIFLGGTVVGRATNVSDPFATPLYRGGHWGPRFLRMPINATGAGINPGESRLANVTLSFLADVYHDAPAATFSTEDGRSTIGAVTLVGPGGQAGPTVGALQETAIAAVVVGAVIVAYVARRRVVARRP